MGRTRDDVVKALGLRRGADGLTEELLLAVQTRGLPRRTMITDSDGKGHVPGLSVRVFPIRLGTRGKPVPGPASFCVQGRVGRGGTVRQVRLGTVGVLPLADARTQAREVLNQLAAGVDVNAVQAEERAVDRARISVLAFIGGDYWRTHLQNRRNGEAEKQRLLAAWKDVLALRIDDLGPDAINAVLQERRDAGLDPDTLIRDWGCLRAMLGRARDAGLIAALPFPDRRRPPALDGLQNQQTKRVRWLGQDDPKEVRRFEAALLDEAAEVRAILRLEALAGFRRGELIGTVYGTRRANTFREVPGLRRSEVNFREGFVTVPAERSKSGRERRVYLNPEAAAVLKGLKVVSTIGLYFPGPVHGWRQRLKKAMDRIRRTVGTDDLVAHDLRHHLATRARQAGQPLEVVRDLLGHASVRTTERYAHVGADELRDAVAKIRI